MAALGLTLAGCYAPKIPDGAFRCDQTNLCPSSFVCGGDGKCYRPTALPDLATGPFVGSGAAGALNLSGMSGLLELNTDTGEVRFTPTGGTASDLFAAGAGGYSQLPQPSGGPNVGLWEFSSVNIPSAVTVRPFGASQSVAAVASSGMFALAGGVDWRGFGGPAGGPGAGGSGRGSIANAGGSGATDAGGSGGGGGGYATNGAAGMGPAGGVGGMSFGEANLVPMHVGAGGGGGSNGAGTGAKAGGGGLGGGAFALFGADVQISGGINVSGNPGKAADPSSTSPAGGGGGGAAGSILVSGIEVTLAAGATLIAVGGAGGAGFDGGYAGGSGADGRIWIGAGTLDQQSSSVAAMPTATVANAPLMAFPR